MCKILTLGGYWPPSSKVEITDFGGGMNCCVAFLASIFLLYVEPKLFSAHVGKFSSTAPTLAILVGCCVPPSTGSHQNSRPRRSLYFYFFLALFDPRKQWVNVLPYTFHPAASPLQPPPPPPPPTQLFWTYPS